MPYFIKNEAILRSILWLDTFLGSSTAVIGLLFFRFWSAFFGLSAGLILLVSAITLLYAIGAFALARSRPIAVGPVRILVYANWAWTIISLFLIFVHYQGATIWGAIFLALQIAVVGGLAYVEGRQIGKGIP